MGVSSREQDKTDAYVPPMKRDVRVVVDPIIVEFCREKTENLTLESQQSVDICFSSTSDKSGYIYGLNASASIAHNEQAQHDRCCALMKIFLDSLVEYDQSFILSGKGAFLSVWYMSFNMSIRQYAKKNHAKEEFFLKLDEFVRSIEQAVFN